MPMNAHRSCRIRTDALPTTREAAQTLCTWLLTLSLAALSACADRSLPPPPKPTAQCGEHDSLRKPYFGDLHVHTTFSFDVPVFGVGATPEDAYRFARGEPILVAGAMASLERPLDFAAVTDHVEYLGEVDACTDPGSGPFEALSCQIFRNGGLAGQSVFATQTVLPLPVRDASVCGEDGSVCRQRSASVWGRIVEAAEGANDESDACTFASLIAYEYTANTGASSQHRNVIFANNEVPPPISYVEEPTVQGLWLALEAQCIKGIPGCEVLAIPHNSNQSNGNAFRIEYPGAESLDDERNQAALRAQMEPLLEVFQHKSDSECRSGLSGVIESADEFCAFEKLRRGEVEDCVEGTGAGGTGNGGCVSRRDFLRGILLSGLAEEERLGVNPYALGVIASTDTHLGTPGAVEEDSFRGHRGDIDDEPAERLQPDGNRAGTRFNPGGLAGVWAEENSRPSLFAALRRREVFGTSGPRIPVRFFGGWSFGPDLCGDPQLIDKAYRDGVPMGSVLPASADTLDAPRFVVTAQRDPATATRPGTPLQRIQIVKGWSADNGSHVRVYDVAGEVDSDASVDRSTCTPIGRGADSLCAVWTDPDYRPSERAFYYARVLENPSCRWTTYECNRLPLDERPPTCSDPAEPRTIQERAWTSPIWVGSGDEAGA